MERIVQRVYEGDQEVPEGATEHVASNQLPNGD